MQKQKLTPQTVCDTLGYAAEVGFVTVERGRVGFSAGRPEEIRTLARRAREAGYRITAALASVAKEVR